MTDQKIHYSLLQRVYAINEKHNAIAQVTGLRFNVFDILDLTTNEVRLHSAFIAALLDPKGSHGFGDKFLNYFLNQIKNQYQETEFAKGLEKFNPHKASVVVEKYIGRIDDSWETGGRIDIKLEDINNNKIILENKIHAKEQKNWLERYHRHDKNAPILYLTLDGKNQTSEINNDGAVDTNESIVNDPSAKDKHRCISYKTDIINWLELCLKDTVNFPILRETINQYIRTINKLTNQLNSIEMKEITETITATAANFEAAKILANSYSKIKNDILTQFWNEIKEELEKLGHQAHYTKNSLDVRCPALFIKTNTEGRFIGIEPLNGIHNIDKFNTLFIGIYQEGANISDYTGPYPEWSKKKSLDLDFDNATIICGIHNDIVERKKIKEIIINYILEYYEKHKQ
jgi:hypothetical protein